MIEKEPKKIKGIKRFVKRTADILMSLTGILLTLPLMLLIALAVKLCDGGPVLYRQVRLTENGRQFLIAKFRSMRVDAEKDGICLAKRRDGRVTPVGRLIRKVHMDELPQLFNVLFGDMSMVGPRPERPEMARRYEELLPDFHKRLAVKAGLTGYAQVYGKYDSSPEEKLAYDLKYIEEFSFSLDLRLLLLTPGASFTNGGSEPEK